MYRVILAILLSVSLVSCFKENDYVIKPIPIPQTKIPYSIYEYETYFSLSDAKIVAHNNYADWDLGFESTESGYHIILNSSRFMYAGNTGSTDFNGITTNIADTMIFDRSSGNLDSTAIGNWGDFSDMQNPTFYQKVYIINRGVDENGTSFGFKKIIFEKLENNTYYIHFANLDNTDEHFFQIPKNPSLNFVQFSFENGGNLNTQQPNKELWDFNLTKYSTILFDNNNIPTPYMVRGALINSGISVAKDTITPFESISFENISSYTFSNKQDAIGYDWKIYKNDNYIVKLNYSYIIKDRSNNYYKLRFTDFYNSIDTDPNFGEKGYLSFQFEKLDYVK
mgnify:CR=1 FL=1